ncbi:4-oxalocrotonate tautomerase [Ruegeria lacuscaerulensis]|uniref:4-oxalocrotonate tautomerase n=1 Tax=Ruegeria lacuscaerulensis TaxID=55218 RepID=UPI00147FBBA5|nr:4-oxalocrotonate tautomerase [Ruegeria lacuscaerulensis]
MPLYTLASKKPFPEQIRFDIAQVITDVHCGLTGAPSEFVNVVFMTGYSMRRGTVLGVNGNVRMGGDRTAGLYEKLNEQMHTRISEAAQLEKSKVLVTLIGIESNWVVEGGMVLPFPGDEADWLERKNATHAAMGIGPVTDYI